MDDAVMPDDPWTWVRPRSADELSGQRRLALAILQEHEESEGREFAMPKHGFYTCDDCGCAPRCVLAFDPYNTDGDCLASK